MHGNLCMDFIAKYENLQDDFNTLCEQLNLPATTLPHKRKATDRESYHGYYSDDLAELVAQHFQKDIQMLGYRF